MYLSNISECPLFMKAPCVFGPAQVVAAVKMFPALLRLTLSPGRPKSGLDFGASAYIGSPYTGPSQPSSRHCCVPGHEMAWAPALKCWTCRMLKPNLANGGVVTPPRF